MKDLDQMKQFDAGLYSVSDIDEKIDSLHEQTIYLVDLLQKDVEPDDPSGNEKSEWRSEFKVVEGTERPDFTIQLGYTVLPRCSRSTSGTIELEQIDLEVLEELIDDEAFEELIDTEELEELLNEEPEELFEEEEEFQEAWSWLVQLQSGNFVCKCCSYVEKQKLSKTLRTNTLSSTTRWSRRVLWWSKRVC